MGMTAADIQTIGVIGAGRIGIVHLEALASCDNAKAGVQQCDEHELRLGC